MYRNLQHFFLISQYRDIWLRAMPLFLSTGKTGAGKYGQTRAWALNALNHISRKKLNAQEN